MLRVGTQRYSQLSNSVPAYRSLLGETGQLERVSRLATPVARSCSTKGEAEPKDRGLLHLLGTLTFFASVSAAVPLSRSWRAPTGAQLKDVEWNQEGKSKKY